VKAKLSLPECPPALCLVAALDILVVLLLFFTLIPVVAQQAGITFVPAKIPFRMQGADKKITVTAKGGAQPILYLGRKNVRLDDLEGALVKAREDDGIELVVLMADEKLQNDVFSRILVATLNSGMELALRGAFPVEETERPVPDDGAKEKLQSPGDDAPEP